MMKKAIKERLTKNKVRVAGIVVGATILCSAGAVGYNAYAQSETKNQQAIQEQQTQKQEQEQKDKQEVEQKSKDKTEDKDKNETVEKTQQAQEEKSKKETEQKSQDKTEQKVEQKSKEQKDTDVQSKKEVSNKEASKSKSVSQAKSTHNNNSEKSEPKKDVAKKTTTKKTTAKKTEKHKESSANLSDSGNESLQNQVLITINKERAKHGARPLSLNSKLSRYAVAKCNEMARGDFSHSVTAKLQKDRAVNGAVSEQHSMTTAGSNLKSEVTFTSECIAQSHLDNSYSQIGIGVKVSNGTIYVDVISYKPM